MPAAPDRRAGRAPASSVDVVDAALPADSEMLRDHLRLQLHGDRRASWTDAAIETAATLLRGVEEQPLAALASRLRVVAEADEVTLARITEETGMLHVVAATGPMNPYAVGDLVPADSGAFASAFRAGQPRLDAEARPRRGPRTAVAARGPSMAVPMRSADRTVGAVLVGRLSGGPAFDEAELDFLATFVDHATVAIELAEARVDRERAALLEDRARIARDLHDTAIQQLFAAGLEIRATAATSPQDTAGSLLHAVGLVDAAIGQIRTAVLALTPDPSGGSLRHRVLDVVHDLAEPFPAPPQLLFDGPVDLIAGGGLADDVVAVVRESLANAARHADADRVGVTVTAADGVLEIEVWDDGRGVPDRIVRSGLANLARRADARGGSFQVSKRSPGTSVRWRAPIEQAGPTG